MWSSALLVSLLAMSPAQSAGKLTISNIRNTYGELGGARPAGKFMPGDHIHVAFDIDNISIDPEGRVQYRMAMEVLDKDKKPVLKQDPTDKTDFVPLGGGKIPGRAYVSIGLDQEPGIYTIKLTVTDIATKSADAFTVPFEVAKKELAIVQVYTSVDERGTIPAPTTGIVGQSIFVQFGVVGFDRSTEKPTDPKADPKSVSQPDISLEMAPIDAAGTPTLGKPLSFKFNAGLDDKAAGIPMRLMVPLTRVGKFSVRIKATDNLTKKSTVFDLPITVLPNGN